MMIGNYEIGILTSLLVFIPVTFVWMSAMVRADQRIWLIMRT
mgnify:FL=1